MLTKKQLDLLLFIDERIKEDGIPPSFEEMKNALELNSKSGIHRILAALEERGFIRRLLYRARAIEVIKRPNQRPAMQLYLCTDHDSYSFKKCGSLVWAETLEEAYRLLDEKLEAQDLMVYAQHPYTLRTVDINRPQAIIICDGEQ